MGRRLIALVATVVLWQAQAATAASCLDRPNAASRASDGTDTADIVFAPSIAGLISDDGSTNRAR